MPWDSSLNKDLKDQLKKHVVLTHGLDKNDPRKFSMATPALIEQAVQRLVAPSDDPGIGVPSGYRIIQDVEKCAGPNLLAIVAAEGAVVDGLGDRNGKRRLPTGQRGGKRVRREPARAPWLHPDAQAGVDQIIDTARLRHDQNVHLL
jgi:hypothetical protein